MSDTYGSRGSACIGKRRHSSYDSARKAAKRLESPHVLVYTCDYCGYFHVGRYDVPGERIGARLRRRKKAPGKNHGN